MDNIDKICNELIEWLQLKVKEANAEGLVFGLSGGIDSAVVAGLAKNAFPNNSLGIIMPCHSDPIDEEHGRMIADKLDLRIDKVDLSSSFDVLFQSIPEENKSKMAISNLKPKIGRASCRERV